VPDAPRRHALRRRRQTIRVGRLVDVRAMVSPLQQFAGLRLGTTTLTLDNLTHYEHQLRSWFTDVDSPEMSLLASNVAGGTIGSEFIAQLKTITGAKVRASTQRIGQGHWLTSTAKTFKPLVLNTYSATI
ncbi:MAG: DUF4347 domain-containing protein, partial [Cyanobacteria bacterium P01_F01_bin.3]